MSSIETSSQSPNYDKKEYREIGQEKLIRFLELTDAQKHLENPDDRVNFLLAQSEDDFNKWLLRINGFMRDTPTKQNEFDGYSVESMTLLPPEYEDKQDLLSSCYKAIHILLQKYQQAEDQQGKDDILLNIALLAQSAIVLIHPFENGNGRTSRVLSELILSGYDDSDKAKQMLANNISKHKMTFPNVVGLRRERNFTNIVNVYKETRQARSYDNDITIDYGDYMANEEYEQVSDDIKSKLSDEEQTKLRHTTRSTFLRLAEHILSNDNPRFTKNIILWATNLMILKVLMRFRKKK